MLARHGGAGGLQQRERLLGRRRQLRELDAVAVDPGGAAGDDLDGLGECLELVLARRLVGLVLGGLGLVCGLDLGQQLLVRGLVVLRRGELALGLRRGGGRRRLDCGLLVAVRGGLGDHVAEVQLREREGVRLVGLVLLDVGELGLELLMQALQQGDDVARLELVGRDVWRARLRRLAALRLKEGSQHAGHALHAGRHLLQQQHGLRAVVRLGAEDLDGALERIHGLA
mmetsp:Transcript_3055/g.7974  ORF Transcript_3055/g.7974 Transcript_3055/m.7974 type:complete len:228 (-) Transcript_3055:492-1175(-)